MMTIRRCWAALTDFVTLPYYFCALFLALLFDAEESCEGYHPDDTAGGAGGAEARPEPYYCTDAAFYDVLLFLIAPLLGACLGDQIARHFHWW